MKLVRSRLSRHSADPPQPGPGRGVIEHRDVPADRELQISLCRSNPARWARSNRPGWAQFRGTNNGSLSPNGSLSRLAVIMIRRRYRTLPYRTNHRCRKVLVHGSQTKRSAARADRLMGEFCPRPLISGSGRRHGRGLTFPIDDVVARPRNRIDPFAELELKNDQA